MTDRQADRQWDVQTVNRQMVINSARMCDKV
jgi:hypothetical protein